MSTYEFQYGFEEHQQNLEFQNFDSAYSYNSSEYPVTPTNLYSPTSSAYNKPSIFTPTYDYPQEATSKGGGGNFDDDELPLLEELEIFPQRIIQKSLAVLNPFHNNKGLLDDADFLFRDTDLAGPIAFFLALAFCLFLSNTRKDIFGYVYGLSIITVLFMYVLIKLMCTTISESQNYITVSSVASILGYSILPIVWLSIPGIFFTLNNKIGILLALCAVFMSTTASSRIFCLMTGDSNQRFLIAYPCALVYVIFSLLVLF